MKYRRTYNMGPSKPRPWKIHPIWRGIGCFLILLIPIMAYAGGLILVRENATRGWVEIPPELAGSFDIPFLGSFTYVELAATVILMVIGFAALTIVYAFIYSLIGPDRYGPLDSPPLRRR